MQENKLELVLGVSLGATQNVPKYHVTHCSDVSYAANKDQFNSINTYHRDEREFPKSSLGFFVGYHNLFTGGKQYKCREDWEVGAHCNQGYDGVTVYPPGTPGKLSMNYQSLGDCIGFDGDIEMPPLIELGLFQKRLWEVQDKYPNIIFEFHRDFATGKTCPGSLITPKWLTDLLVRPSTVIPPKPVEKMCVAQEKEIVELKKKLVWYEEIFKWIAQWFS